MTLFFALILLAAPPASPTTVAGVDWANHSYPVADAMVHLKNGEWRRQSDDFAETLSLGGVHPVDVDGDGKTEVLVALQYWGGGTGQFDELHIYRVGADGPKRLAGLPGGDRGDGGVDGIRIEGREIIIDRRMSLPADGACCPTLSRIERWIWRNGRMTLQLDMARVVVGPYAEGTAKQPYADALKMGRDAMGAPKPDPITAASHFGAACIARPDDAVALGELGFALWKQNPNDSDIEFILSAAVAGQGPDATKAAALYNLGRLYEARKDVIRALEATRQSLKLRPGNKPTMGLQTRLEALLAKPAEPARMPAGGR